MDEDHDEYGWHADETPAPIHYRIEGDDRRWLAYRTSESTEPGRTMLTLVVDKEDARAFEDTMSIHLDDPSLSVWENGPQEPEPEYVTIRLVREATGNNPSVTVKLWRVGKHSGLLIPTSEITTPGRYVLMEDSTHLETITKGKRGRIQRHVVKDPSVELRWGEF